MLQLRGRLDLAQEPLGAERGAEVGMQHLDRDVAIVLEVVREVDGRHAAGAELALDAVAVGKRGGELVACLDHRVSARAWACAIVARAGGFG